MTELEAYKFLIESSGYGIELNINDIFAWGCADSETLDSEDAKALIPFIQEYGYTALIAYASVKRAGALPQEPVLKDIREEFYKVQKELQDLATKGEILWEDYYDMEKRREEMRNYGGQTASWYSFSDRFKKILHKEPNYPCVMRVAKLKDGTIAVGRSYHEAASRLKRNYERRKKR